MYPRASQSANCQPIPVTQFIMPLLAESAKELLDEDPLRVQSICLKDLEEEMCKKVYGKLWKRGLTVLAMTLQTTGWMRQFTRSAIMAVAANLEEKRGDADAE